MRRATLDAEEDVFGPGMDLALSVGAMLVIVLVGGLVLYGNLSSGVGVRKLELRVAKEQAAKAQQELAALRKETARIEAVVAEEREQYRVVKSKLEELLRPERSPKGKKVISVQFSRANGSLEIRVKPVGGSAWEVVTEERMQAILTAARRSHGSNLYVKVIFPENNRIYQDEASRRTSELHSKYDYYYRAERRD